MSNPKVRPHLHFLPEDSGDRLSEAWQAARWRVELDPNLACPMVRVGDHDFYVYEPAQLTNGSMCVPVRWFTRGSRTFAKAWPMVPLPDGAGWVVLRHAQFEVDSEQFLTPLPSLVSTHVFQGVPDPRRIIGMYSSTSVLRGWLRY